MKLRTLHRKTAPILFIPLLLTAITGMGYRIGRRFGISDRIAEAMLAVHEGDFLGDKLGAVYVLLIGLGLVGLIITGLTLLRRSLYGPKQLFQLKWRPLHRLLAPLFFLPLALSAITGVLYRIGGPLGLSNGQKSLMMNLHQGTLLGPKLRLLYVTCIGLGLLGLLFSGILITGIVGRRSLKTENS